MGVAMDVDSLVCVAMAEQHPQRGDWASVSQWAELAQLAQQHPPEEELDQQNQWVEPDGQLGPGITPTVQGTTGIGSAGNWKCE